MSRIQAGALVAEIDVIPLTELVEPAVSRMRSQLAGHSVTIDLPADLPSVRADATFLSQALSNLLENAARYAPPGAPIAISASSHPERGTVTLIVEDGGPGVPPEALPRLFERFYRAPPSSAGARRGFGLGLSVVEGLVVAMGGRVRADQSSLGGLAITVELPADPGRQ
jgi:two-component system sensor histidine kinase KdpD